jgi:hypothetical protein
LFTFHNANAMHGGGGSDGGVGASEIQIIRVRLV